MRGQTVRVTQSDCPQGASSKAKGEKSSQIDEELIFYAVVFVLRKFLILEPQLAPAGWQA